MSAFPEYVNQKTLADFLQVPQSSLSDLIRNGVIERQANRQINFAKALHDFHEHKAKKKYSQKAEGSSADRLREKRIEELTRKLKREDKDLITSGEMVETIDELSVVLDGMLKSLPMHLTESVRERQRIESVIRSDRKRFMDYCDKTKQKLENGAI